MSRFMFAVLFFVNVPILAYAQDAGAPVGSLVQCITLCNERHPMCVSTHDVQECLDNIPECQNLASSDSSVINAFCEACGRGADGCEAPADAGVPVGTGSVLAYESTPTDEPGVTTGLTPPPTTETPPSTTEEPRARRHRDDAPPRPPPLRTVEDMCRVAGGIWDPDYVVIQSRPPTATAELTDTTAPHEGEEVRGVCWTREGERLARLLRSESTARTEADATESAARIARDEELADVDDEIISVNDSQADMLDTLFIRVACLEHAGGNVPLTTFTSTRRAEIRARALEYGYLLDGESIRCPEIDSRTTRRTATAATSAATPRYTPSRPGTIGFRFSLMPGVGFQPITGLQPESPVPFYLMGELSLTASIGGDWFLDGGLAFGYPFPDFRGRAMLEGLYHLGFLALIENTVAVGFGGTLQERYTDVFQSMHTIPGGYIEIDYNLRRGGWQPYVGVRIDLGVGLRPDYNPVFDGSAFLMLGIAHLDADDGNVHPPDCDTEYCRDTPVGRVQVP